jgi:threonine-phosphate decarboxylase
MTEFLPPHGGQLRQIADRFGIPVVSLRDFSANLNPEGPPAAVLTCLRASLEDPSTLIDYPDLGESELRQSFARYAGVGTENVVAANGFVPLLDAVLRVLPIRRCLVPVPAFVEYRKTLERSHIEMVPRPLSPASSFRYEAEELLSGSSDAILLANPQNPSGVLTSHETLSCLVEEASRRNIYVLIDEAFIDYCPEASLVVEVNRFPNLVIFRSVTKLFGMAGLRVAYALTNATLARQLQDALAPWAITTLASLAARAAVEDEVYTQRTIMLNDARRRRLQSALEERGIDVYPAAANFLLVRVPGGVDCQRVWERLIRQHGIVLRNCANYEALADGHLRVAVRTEAENERLVDALANLFHDTLISTH